MAEHTMKLHPAPYSMIQSGKKTIELRLYDEKRREITVGDTIRFLNTAEKSESLVARVTELYRFDSFEELYRTLPLLECGYTEEDVGTASPKDMEFYYPPEKQAKYGVVGIRIAVLAGCLGE